MIFYKKSFCFCTSYVAPVQFKPLPADAEQPFFTLIDTVGTFDAQQAACESQGLTLASITSEAENKAANEACQGVCYIGLSRPLGSALLSDWVWVDGTPVTYTNWLPNNGGDTDESRGALRPEDDHKWHDWGNGDTLLNAVCRGVYDYTAWAGGWSVSFPGFSSVYRISKDGSVSGSHCDNQDDCGSGQIKLQPDGRYLLSGHLANNYREFLSVKDGRMNLTRCGRRESERGCFRRVSPFRQSNSLPHCHFLPLTGSTARAPL